MKNTFKCQAINLLILTYILEINESVYPIVTLDTSLKYINL